MSDILKVTKPVVDYALLSKDADPTMSKTGTKDTPNKMEKVAKDFEALFIFNMLKELDKTTRLDKKGYAEETYTSVIYQKVSEFISKNSGLGIKEFLLRYHER
ncbi:MAG: flagellar rod assembly protein/muramidase FlgJ [Syntrophorhabdus sp. PtaU1.Bin153]|nr:MAG: flagellar rod assembly protein/muramidase FlgJ [Syntrophorhabdus sp. PtaU1.Bin153]